LKFFAIQHLNRASTKELRYYPFASAWLVPTILQKATVLPSTCFTVLVRNTLSMILRHAEECVPLK
jgi:hypothetical protein